ncbi:MAG: serine hydrolase, partial [Gemmatimonadetes bacterium]|nr:serine hydrolase [Gemmatimonadota bacterium]
LAACGSPAPREAAAREQPAAHARAAADTPVSAAARLTGPDSAVLRARIDSVFAKFDRPGSPGCMVTVMDAGRIVFGRGYGSADIERGTPFTTASAFDGASMAKQFTTFGILLLEREGKLSLDDPVQKHLPELPDYGARVTLRHLIHHTSGLRDAETGWLTGGRISDPALIPSLSFPPGERHYYDDTGYDLLGRVTERVSGQSIGEFQRTRIFGPLGMDRTAVAGVRRVRAYAPDRDGEGFHLAMTRDGGGFTTTPEDLARWDANFYDARVGGREVVEAMMREGRLNSGETIPYAMALHTEPYRGLRRLWHGGLSAGYRSQFMRYPDQRTSVLVMCNVYQYAEPNSLAERVSDVVLADEIAEAERRSPGTAAVDVPPPSAAELRRYQGVYVNREEQFVRAVRVHQGQLQMRQWITWYGLRPLGGGRFRVEGQPLTLTFRDAADGARVVEEQADGRRTPLVLRAASDARPSAAELDRYTGAYRSDELRSTWTVSRAGDELRVTGGPRGGLRLRPAGGDVFTDGSYVYVQFRRDSAGRVTGLTAATQRVQNLHFVKRSGP